jgi:hypothetical protein
MLSQTSDATLPGLQVVRELDAIVTRRGQPTMCVSEVTSA